MSYSEYIQFSRKFGTSRTGVEDGEIALKKSDAIIALNLLSDTCIGVLGGDVYELESDGYFRPTYDNWYCNKDKEAQIPFSKKSQKIACDYLTTYKEAQSKDIFYVIVLDDSNGQP